MKGKSLVESKEFWVLGLTFVMAFFTLPEFVAVLPSTWLPYITLVGAGLALALRTFFTSAPITSIFPKR